MPACWRSAPKRRRRAGSGACMFPAAARRPIRVASHGRRWGCEPAAVSELPLLTVRGVTKRFPGTLALDDFALDVEAGEVHALLGENGAGKSTFIKVLAGVYPPDDGEIRLAGLPL